MYITLKEAAKKYNINVPTVYYLAKKMKNKIRTGGTEKRMLRKKYSEEDLLKIFKEVGLL